VIVVNSSAVVDALTAVAGSDDLRSFMIGEELAAPTMLNYEVVSALRVLCLGGHLSSSRAEDVLTDFDDLPIQRWPLGNGLRRRALQLRDNVSASDAAYLALAEALDCPLLTRDPRLARSTGHAVRIEVR
jgi:predicted nucleic acid-binding protein